MSALGDEYAPDLVFTDEQREELRSIGCDARLLAVAAYHVGREREDRRVQLTPEEDVKRTARKLARRARALEEALREVPAEIRKLLANALTFSAERGASASCRPGDFERLHQALRTVASAAEERSALVVERGRPQREEVLIDGVRVEQFTLSLLADLQDEGLELSSTLDGSTAKVLELCRIAAGLDPARGETLVRYYLRPAVNVIRR